MILLGLGSNLESSFGDRFKNLELAIKYLSEKDVQIIKKSSFYETPSYPDKKKPKYINMVISVNTELNPVELASVIISVEEKLERKRKKKNDPRTCDIDILDFNNKIIKFTFNNLFFYVPHRKLSVRNFVLFPIKELSPSWIHPETKEDIDKLINNINDDDKKSILKVKKY